VYQAASTAAEQGVQTVSIDEMTGIQALERASPSLPMKPGHVERREFEYIRHGTKALIAAFDVASGKVRGTIGDRRTDAASKKTRANGAQGSLASKANASAR
jgi:hypothetical protein